MKRSDRVKSAEYAEGKEAYLSGYTVNPYGDIERRRSWREGWNDTAETMGMRELRLISQQKHPERSKLI